MCARWERTGSQIGENGVEGGVEKIAAMKRHMSRKKLDFVVRADEEFGTKTPMNCFDMKISFFL